MSRDMLKNSFPISLILRILRASLIIFEATPPIPQKAARRGKDSCIRESHPLGEREIQLLSQQTFTVDLINFRQHAWCFLKQ